jgi:hypothetical protein
MPYVFSDAPQSIRRSAGESVEDILASVVIHVIPQSRDSFLAGMRKRRVDRGSHQRPAF